MSQDMPDPENIKRSRPSEGKKPPKKITEKYLYNAGLAYLQRFPASIPHFRQVMQRRIDRSCKSHPDQDREVCKGLLEKTIETFVRMGLLNDAFYLQGMITSLRRRGLSSQSILYRLQQKGLIQENIKSALRDYDEEQSLENPDLAAALLLTRRKKIGPFRREDRPAPPDTSKEIGVLARAGFSFDIAQKALKMPLEEAKDTLAAIRI